MSSALPLARSSDLMSRDDTALLVIDVQERLLPAMSGRERLVWNIGRLIDGARQLGLPVLATEQYPEGLGRTVAELSRRLGTLPAKRSFSCAGVPGLFEQLGERGIFRLLLTGIESHVCVQQTALDLIHAGFRIYVAVDAVTSRQPLDHEVALRRMETAGATLTTTEAALFEWCETSTAPEFKAISALVKSTGPQTDGT